MVNRARLLSSVSSFGPGATSISTTLAPGLPTVMGSSTDLPTGTSSLRTTSPPTDRVTGAVPPAGSSMRNLVMTSRPTTPKRGDCSSTISRSRSSFLPAIRACKRRAAQLGRQPGRHVVHLAVGQQHHARQPFRRHFDQRRAHGLDQARAARPFAAELDVRRRQHRLAHFEPFLLAELALRAPRAPPGPACGARRSPSNRNRRPPPAPRRRSASAAPRSATGC